eukprot:615961-Pyramimonas_sp.AAC.1
MREVGLLARDAPITCDGNLVWGHLGGFVLEGGPRRAEKAAAVPFSFPRQARESARGLRRSYPTQHERAPLARTY